MPAVLNWHTPKAPQLRYCAKVSLAAIAAYVLTLGDRNEYALYSVMGAALVVGGSVGENLNSSLNRVLGTLAGTVVGVGLASTLGMSIWSLGIAVAVLAWLSVGFGWGAAALRVGIAMTLVVLFTHTADAVQYGGWRVLNTLIGVTIGVVTSWLVWPIRGRDEIKGAIDQVLAATAATLDALARGSSPDELLPLQVQVLDALAAGRTARKNARLERQVDRGAELLTTHTMQGARAAIATLGASVTLGELAQGRVRAESLDAVRRAIEPLAALAKDVTATAQSPGEFPSLREQALREAAHPDLDTETRVLLTGLLSDLQQISAALQAIRDAPSGGS